MRRLELSCKHIGLISVGGHVHRTLVDTLLFLTLLDHEGFAVDEWDDRELLLRDRFLHLACVLVPGCTLKLEAENICAVVETLEHLLDFGLPMELLLDISLNVELVKALSSLLSTDLLDSSEERVRFVETIEETDGLVDQSWLVLPQVKELKTLFHVVEPRVETTRSHPTLLSPLVRQPVQLDLHHEIFHCCCHGQLSLEGKVEVFEVDNHHVDESVDKLALLHIHVLVGSTLLVVHSLGDLIDWQALTLDLDLVENALGEFTCDIDNCHATFSSATAALWLQLYQNREE